MTKTQNFDVQALHDMVAGTHQTYFDMGGAQQRIDLMLCVVVQGRPAFVILEADDQDQWYAKAALVLLGLDAAMYCVTSEAWMATAALPGDPVNKLPPSKRNDRSEVVATVAVDRQGRSASSVKVIDRYADGERVGAVRSLTDCTGLGMSDGRMFRIFEMAGLA